MTERRGEGESIRERGKRNSELVNRELEGGKVREKSIGRELKEREG